MVNAKTKIALKHGLIPVVAVGETLKEREGFQSGDRVVVISDIIAGSGIDAIQIRAIN